MVMLALLGCDGGMSAFAALFGTEQKSQTIEIASPAAEPVADFALPGTYDMYGTKLELREGGRFTISEGEEICGLQGSGAWTVTREVESWRNADLVMDSGETLVLIQDRMSKSGIGLNCPVEQNPYEPDLYLERVW